MESLEPELAVKTLREMPSHFTAHETSGSSTVADPLLRRLHPRAYSALAGHNGLKASNPNLVVASWVAISIASGNHRPRAKAAATRARTSLQSQAGFTARSRSRRSVAGRS
jgi:hypothetical protein